MYKMNAPDRFTLSAFELFALRTRTRFPFRYGIASMTDVPQLFVRTRVTAGDGSGYGVTAEGLPPKWFTKNPGTTFEQDLPEMLDVIRHAASLAAAIARTPTSFFDLWRELNRQQADWAAARGIAPLLSHLGVSLVERAVLDGLCRLAGAPLHAMIAANRLGLRLGDVYSDLHGTAPDDVLPARPRRACFVRHTIGLGDALTPADIPPAERADDGLPQDLEASIRAYGLRYFKVKLSGSSDRDTPRLQALARLLDRATAGAFVVTVDGNENFEDLRAFRAFYDRSAADPLQTRFWTRVVVVEQPVHRDRALADESGDALRAWPGRPPIIIDESDAAVGDVPRAFALGYAGASHKNCKGIVKGIANACLIAKRALGGAPGVLTGEDLCTLGPVALLQDMAMMALLGIAHVERNGHHYYRGLSMLPAAWQQAALAAHGDLYRAHPAGFPALHISGGRLALGSVNDAPFGVAPLLDLESVTPL